MPERVESDDLALGAGRSRERHLGVDQYERTGWRADSSVGRRRVRPALPAISRRSVDTAATRFL